MKTDNVLVSREKWCALVEVTEALKLLGIKTLNHDMVVLANTVLDMPDFVESEEDVEVVVNVLNRHQGLHKNDVIAQAAINALKIKGE